MIKSIKDRRRVIELLKEGMKEGTLLDVIGRIFEELPHITAADISEIAAVCAEESRMDAAEHEARAEGKL